MALSKTRSADAATFEANPDVEYIQVKGTDPERVAFFERHDDHPGGEVLITGDEDVKTVAETPAVLQALSLRRLVYSDDDGNEVKTRARATVDKPDANDTAAADDAAKANAGTKAEGR